MATSPQAGRLANFLLTFLIHKMGTVVPTVLCDFEDLKHGESEPTALHGTQQMPQINYRNELVFLPAITGVSSSFGRQYRLFPLMLGPKAEPHPLQTHFYTSLSRALLALLPSTGSRSCPPPGFWCLIKPSVTALLTGAACRVLFPPFRLCALPVSKPSSHTDATVRGTIRPDGVVQKQLCICKLHAFSGK